MDSCYIQKESREQKNGSETIKLIGACVFGDVHGYNNSGGEPLNCEFVFRLITCEGCCGFHGGLHY